MSLAVRAVMTRWPLLLILALSVLDTGCDRAVAESRNARHIMRLTGFDMPESVRYDPDQDVFFVSNILGNGSVADGNGYISRVDAGNLRRGDHFIRSGINGVLLDAPKGMAIQGDTLWVADIDFVRGFNRRTGAPVANLDLSRYDVVMLNDIALGPDGALYVTDTGIIMSPVGVVYDQGSKIFRIAPGRTVSLFAKGDHLAHPNGITWDSAGQRWLVVTFHQSFSELYALNARTGQREALIAYGLGKWDGLEKVGDKVLFTSWTDSSLHMIRGGERRQIVRDIWQPADLGVDTRRNRVAIPMVLQGRVEIWELPN